MESSLNSLICFILFFVFYICGGEVTVFVFSPPPSPCLEAMREGKFGITGELAPGCLIGGKVGMYMYIPVLYIDTLID